MLSCLADGRLSYLEAGARDLSRRRILRRSARRRGGCRRRAAMRSVNDARMHDDANALPLPPTACLDAPLAPIKGDFGRVVALCGSVGMAGAAVLSARAASCCGAGLVEVCAPRSLYPVLAGHLIEQIITPLEETGQRHDRRISDRPSGTEHDARGSLSCRLRDGGRPGYHRRGDVDTVAG